MLKKIYLHKNKISLLLLILYANLGIQSFFVHSQFVGGILHIFSLFIGVPVFLKEYMQTKKILRKFLLRNIKSNLDIENTFYLLAKEIIKFIYLFFFCYIIEKSNLL